MANIPIHIGDVVVSREPAVLSTVLGSCVSVALYDPIAKAGGLIHYALPNPGGGEEGEPNRYGSFAIPALIEALRGKGGTAGLKAKIVGGASCLLHDHERAQVGALNVALARELLAKAGIPVIGEDVGGPYGRKVFFHTDTGRLQVASVIPKDEAISSGPQLAAKSAKAIRVLIVDDSKTIRDLLSRIIREDPGLEVAGTAANAEEALPLLKSAKPDVVTLDIHMPGLDGVAFLEKFLPKFPLPTVMITTLSRAEGGKVLHALEIGAVDYVQKPNLSDLPNFAPLLREKLRVASEARVRAHQIRNTPRISVSGGVFDSGAVIALGASTGGTEALKEVLLRLPAAIPPTVIVQHIPPVFSRAFADRLAQLCPFAVKEAEHGDKLRPGLVLIAPGGRQMKLARAGDGLEIRLTDDPPVNRHRPSVDYLFESVAEHVGAKAVAAILTGMGSDGATGLLALRKKGARTIAQDEATSVVYGMPKAARQNGGAEMERPLDEIAGTLMRYLQARKTA